jgi:hypothetical protein
MNIHPLRLIYLGSFASEQLALRYARRTWTASELDPAATMARNVRIACDRQQTKRWRLSAVELQALRDGQPIAIRDTLGSFTVGYERLAP